VHEVEHDQRLYRRDGERDRSIDADPATSYLESSHTVIPVPAARQGTPEMSRVSRRGEWIRDAEVDVQYARHVCVIPWCPACR